MARCATQAMCRVDKFALPMYCRPVCRAVPLRLVEARSHAGMNHFNMSTSADGIKMNIGNEIRQPTFSTPPISTAEPAQRQSRSTGSQTMNSPTTPPVHSAADVEEQPGRNAASAVRERERFQQRRRPVTLSDFHAIKKSDLRRGDVLITHEAIPTSDSHERIQTTQRHLDLNAIENNCGMAEIIHAGIIMRNDVVQAEKNFRHLESGDHPYLSERGGKGTTFTFKAIGSAVPQGTGLVYRATDPIIAKNLADDAQAKEGIPYSKMEYGTSLRREDFVLPDGLAERNTISHILAVDLDKHQTPWANRITVDDVSDERERFYAESDRLDAENGRRMFGRGATCSTFIVKGVQAAVGKMLIDRMGPENSRLWESQNRDRLKSQARTVYHEALPADLRIDAKRISPKSLQHLLETLELDGTKMFNRVGALQVKKMAYPERRFKEETGEEIEPVDNACCFPCLKIS